MTGRAHTEQTNSRVTIDGELLRELMQAGNALADAVEAEDAYVPEPLVERWERALAAAGKDWRI